MAKAKEKLKSLTKKTTKTRSKRGKHCLWTDSAMISAIAAVRKQNMSQRQACKTFRIPRCTLQVRQSGITEINAKSGHPILLSTAQEEKLVDYACNQASMGIGFERKQLFKYAGNFKNKHKVAFKRESPSLKWWRLLTT